MPSNVVPEVLTSLLEARDEVARESAWTAFLAAYSDLVLRASRQLGGDADALMDRYAFVVQQLRRDDCQRLRRYVADGRGAFATWLVLVVRRLCLDEHRQRYGRPQSTDAVAKERHAERRRLVDLIGSEIDIHSLTIRTSDDADGQVRLAELHQALRRALGRLETGDRLLLRLRFEDGLSVPEIARILRAESPAHVYRRLERLFASLREMLQEAGVSDSRP